MVNHINEIRFSALSRKQLNREQAYRQIDALASFDDPSLCPDHWGTFEPIKKIFHPGDLSEPLSALVEPHGSFLYKAGKPARLTGSMWNRMPSAGSPFPTPTFNNLWHCEVAGTWAANDEFAFAKHFALKMFEVSGAEFAFATTAADFKAKNTSATRLSYQGLTFQSGIPGLYWLNFFSNELADWAGLATLPPDLAKVRRLPEDAWSITFCDNPYEAISVDVLQRQQQVIEWIGAEKFFNIAFPDRPARLPKWR